MHQDTEGTYTAAEPVGKPTLNKLILENTESSKLTFKDGEYKLQ